MRCVLVARCHPEPRLPADAGRDWAVQLEQVLTMSDFPTTDYFRAEAEQLRQFAEEATDPEIAEMYRRLACRFEAKALVAEAEGSVH
jgi:hypothetical protein